jgi:hypothetical protein
MEAIVMSASWIFSLNQRILAAYYNSVLLPELERENDAESFRNINLAEEDMLNDVLYK